MLVYHFGASAEGIRKKYDKRKTEFLVKIISSSKRYDLGYKKKAKAQQKNTRNKRSILLLISGFS